MLHIEPQLDGMDHPGCIERIILSEQTHAQIAPPLTKYIAKQPHMTEWRKKLRVATDEAEVDELKWHVKCDCMDTGKKWWTCTILAVDEASNRIQFHFDGWSARCDEWVVR